jgi:hypothetical protein
MASALPSRRGRRGGYSNQEEDRKRRMMKE